MGIRRIVLSFLAVMSLVASSRAGDQRFPADKLLFATCVADAAQERCAEILLDSIREFGGAYARFPLVVVVDDIRGRPCDRLKAKGAYLLPLEMSDAARGYPYAEKVFAAAQVERLAGKRARTLAWFDPETLLLGPPRELDIVGSSAVAVQPVFLSNGIGLAPGKAPDTFWERAYAAAGADPRGVPEVEPFIGGEVIRAYYNCGVFSCDPRRGLCREWARVFTALVRDEVFQRTACADARHRIFLHQAAFTSVILSRTHAAERRGLRSGYAYPLHLQERIPEDRRAADLASLTCVICEGMPESLAGWRKIIRIGDPFGGWLEREWRDIPAARP